MHLYIVLILNFLILLNADTDSQKALIHGENLRSVIEAPPRFPGGMTEFFKFLREHTPIDGNRGMGEVSVFINKDGTVDLPAVSSETNDRNKTALLTALAKSPKWTPAIQNGRPMRVGFSLTVTFKSIDQVITLTDEQMNVINEVMIVSFDRVEKDGQKYIQGTVLTKNGEPLVGVNIWSGASYFSGTNPKGTFSMAVPDTGIVNFSCIGHVRKEISL